MLLRNIDHLVRIALDEDIGPGDITTEFAAPSCPDPCPES